LHVRQVEMTPELASKLLEHNLGNRVLTPHRVTAHASAMRCATCNQGSINCECPGGWKGRWIPEAAGPVVIGEDRELQNGQHRLHATIEAQHVWPCVLIEGAPPEARLAHDTGKKRSFADWLRYNDVTQQSLVASVIRLLWFYDNGHLVTRAAWIRARVHLSPDHDQMWEFFQKNDGRVLAALKLGRNADRDITRSVATTGAAILMDVDEGECSDFYRQLSLQGEVSEQVTLLVRSLNGLPAGGTGGSKGDQQHQMALLFKTWNLWRDGEMVQQLRWRMGGKAPEAFPVPH